MLSLLAAEVAGLVQREKNPAHPVHKRVMMKTQVQALFSYHLEKIL